MRTRRDPEAPARPARHGQEREGSGWRNPAHGPRRQTLKGGKPKRGASPGKRLNAAPRPRAHPGLQPLHSSARKCGRDFQTAQAGRKSHRQRPRRPTGPWIGRRQATPAAHEAAKTSVSARTCWSCAPAHGPEATCRTGATWLARSPTTVAKEKRGKVRRKAAGSGSEETSEG